MKLSTSLVRRALGLLAVAASPLLLGCGQKGPLQLPNAGGAASAAAPTPAASR